MLPAVSGIELCRRLRMRPETERPPIIMLTARGEESDRVRGLATGADDYLVKPFSTPEFIARVRFCDAPSRRCCPACSRSATSCSTARRTASTARRARSGSARPSSGCWSSAMQHPGRVPPRSQLLDNVGRDDLYRRAHGRRACRRKAVNNGRMLDVIRAPSAARATRSGCLTRSFPGLPCSCRQWQPCDYLFRGAK